MILILLPWLALASIAAPAKTLLSKEQQFQFSLQKVLSNAQRPDVAAGMVVASPSRQDPDYYFDWVRDTALTMRSLIDLYELRHDKKLRALIVRWVQAEYHRQNEYALTGLGEPKFNVNGTAFMGPWGRPQNDGPALRAIAMIKWARLMLAEGETSYVERLLYKGVLPATTAIKKDLEYTAHHWREPSFDLWEEEQGMHFYTMLAQYTALVEGAKLARQLHDGPAAAFYEANAGQIGHFILTNFTDATVGLKVTTGKVASLGYKHSGLDVAPLLALLHTWPYQKLIPFTHKQVKVYLGALLEDARTSHTVNRAYANLGVAIGRYPEDRYDGYHTGKVGNPWFLSTLALGEFYCLQRGDKALAEKQFQRVLFHSDNGHMSEQFNRDTGFMQGAVDLTWSHNAVLTAMVRCGHVR